MSDGIDILVTPGESPFDRLMHKDWTNREFWLGRDLMPHLGYTTWENFAAAVSRARVACRNAGQTEARNFRDVTKNPSGQVGRPRADVELSRYGAYLVSMNGDPRKPEVAAAQTYFATATRWAETAQREMPRELTRRELLAMAMEAEDARELAEKAAAEAKANEERAMVLADDAARQALEAQAKLGQVDRQLAATLGELGAAQPKLEAYDTFLDAAGAFPLAVAASMLGTGRQKLIQQLCAWRVLVSKAGSAEHLRPYAEHIHEERFVVKNTDVPITHRDGSKEVIIRGTTLVTPKGLDYIRRRMVREAARPQPAPASVA